MQVLAFIILLLSITSCLKTAEEITQEKHVRRLPGQVQQSQKTMARMTLRINELENKFQLYDGQIEEIEYRQKKLIPQSQKEVLQKVKNQTNEIASLRNQISKNSKTLQQVLKKLKEQKSYLTKVNSTLLSLATPTKKVKNPKNYKSLLQGMKYYRAKKYSKAKKTLLYTLKNDKLNPAEKNQVYQALGHIEFKQKKYSKSNIYFSKIFTKYPKSSMAPDALIHMARAFRYQKNKSAAKEAYKTLIRDYKSDRLISTAKKELNAL